ncbi:hypothetical protein QN277_012157 [Acacia crassicarpa]|uniref:Uncharacterized protein n=1 Tax=Acacia crassicarpa TaxID=499986 RepID=A0AAE1N0P7_9FABA|nr:hypothetical protein QN277_012157 [Acacia crassicarpa]
MSISFVAKKRNTMILLLFSLIPRMMP